MFNGVPSEQFHQFIASRSTLPLPLPLTLPLHVSPPHTFSVHELQQQQPSSHQVFQQSHLLQPLHRQTSTHEDEEKEEERVAGVNLEIEGMRSASELMDPWLKEEVLALLTIRSSLGNEFSDFIWGHVSRKLAELGYKRSAEKCKEKFEEVSKYCNNNSYGNYYRSFNELEALFEDQNPKSIDDDKMVRSTNNDQEKIEVNMEENSANETLENPIEENPNIEENQYVVKKPKKKKKKKHHQLELLKGFSEFVNKIMVQQEELHKKLLQDMERREEERVAREEAWKKKEMDRFFKEMEIRAQEQAIACDRESKIIEFLNQFTSNISQTQGLVVLRDNQVLNTPKAKSALPSSTTSINVLLENPSSSLSTKPNAPSSSAIILSPQKQISSPSQNNPQMPNSSSNIDPSSHHNPNLVNTTTPQSNLNIPTSSTQMVPLNPKPINSSASIDREDYGKRWPRDEVNSLINLRCNLQSSVDDKESTKAPLWERISQGMLELGYKRSAKKCKEKWENINKYFRKTKDTNKKRSLDSKTCPYFHQLNTLYNQGRLTMPSEVAENRSASSVATTPPQLETGVGSGASHHHHQDGLSTEAIVHEGEKNMVQVPLEFEY